MKASSFGFCSELIAVCVCLCVYMCIHVCKCRCIYTHVCGYIHGSSHTDDASSQSLAFFPKTALKIKHNPLHNSPMVVFSQAEAVPSGRGNP